MRFTTRTERRASSFFSTCRFSGFCILIHFLALLYPLTLPIACYARLLTSLTSPRSVYLSLNSANKLPKDTRHENPRLLLLTNPNLLHRLEVAGIHSEIFQIFSWLREKTLPVPSSGYRAQKNKPPPRKPPTFLSTDAEIESLAVSWLRKRFFSEKRLPVFDLHQTLSNHPSISLPGLVLRLATQHRTPTCFPFPFRCKPIELGSTTMTPDSIIHRMIFFVRDDSSLQ
ncbi:Protein of unknown function [Pyronema omphalodes CBS 100304]|uniref:Uncharacterized protein n=1 Tax=Pyronema omphalodes (strain CBS 100304) TaxID=1076935 RepID=U4L7W3_PYROM|nr:Protein of unknown function [Pyronema omphalodes CBS 100304]